MKPQRIWTKDYGEQGKEWIELQENKYYIWKAIETIEAVECSFPICFETCREKFKETGREFRPSEGIVDINPDTCHTVFF